MHPRARGLTAAALILLLALLLIACSLAASPNGNGGGPPAPAPGQPAAQPEPERDDPAKLAAAARRVKANELGYVPILVYHLIGEQEGRWTRTPAGFRQDLQELHDRGYVLVALNDLIDGKLKIPAGKSPAIITFDDSSAGQFRLLEQDGKLSVDPNCAAGILRSFAASHPGFGQAATFYVNAFPFGQESLWPEKLKLLQEYGMEIGNHTYSHKNLKGLPPEAVAEEIAKLNEHIRQALPGYTPRSFAIVQDGLPQPYGAVTRGEARGISYQHDSVVWWAWSASRPPGHKEFDPQRIQRIQVFQDKGVSSLTTWLDRLSSTRYVSDGRPDTLAAPASWKESLAPANKQKTVFYEPGEPSRDPAKDKQAAGARGAHLTFLYASSPERWRGFLELTEQAGLNAVQLDVKDESGRIGYASGVKLARETGAARDILPIRAMLAELKSRGLYSIARIVIFRDPVLAEKKPQLMVREKSGRPLHGGAWVDPHAREVWEYNVDLALEAYDLGFDEVQYDYIRYPEGDTAFTDSAGERVRLVADFLKYARSRVGWDHILSATIFGFVAYAVDDQGIGQRPESMAPYVDYLSPMVYPSHYGPKNYGYDNPNANPFGVVDKSMKDFLRLTEGSGVGFRPWLQAFSMGAPSYGRPEIRAQIEASEKNGAVSWLLWNPMVRYRAEEIRPQARAAGEPWLGLIPARTLKTAFIP